MDPLPTPFVLNADCLAVMRTLPDNSIDAIVTDPPYGLSNIKPQRITEAITAWATGDRERVPDGRGFMGKAWDSFVPPPAVWGECLRVLKPGGHLVAFAGSRTHDLMGLSIRMAGFEIRDGLAWLHSQGFPKGGSQLKPAFEPVTLARKALEGTVAANVLKWGTGALNIDGCRIDTDEDTRRNARGGDNGLNGTSTYRIRERRADEMPKRTGRWPANVVLDEDQAAALDEQSGTSKSRIGNPRGAAAGVGWGMTQTGSEYDDEGGASRFFYCAKASSKERPEVDGVKHPTVKPLSLMRWLVRLVTPEGGTVYDPFAGSGTTIEAATLEGFAAFGSELDPTYAALCQARIDRAPTTERQQEHPGDSCPTMNPLPLEDE